MSAWASKRMERRTLSLPVVIVGEAAQAGLQAADDDGMSPKTLRARLAYTTVAWSGRSPHADRGVGVAVAALLAAV